MSDYKSVISILQHTYVLADLYIKDVEDTTMNFCSLWIIK